MFKLTAALALVALLASVSVADARGGRMAAADCEAGSDDPDCPDAPASSNKAAASSGSSQPSAGPARK